MRELRLTTWERLELRRCIPPDAPMDDLPALLRLLDILVLSDEEKETVGYREVEVLTAQGPGLQPLWDEPEMEFTLEFETGDFERLLVLVEARPRWPTLPETLALRAKVEGVGD